MLFCFEPGCSEPAELNSLSLFWECKDRGMNILEQFFSYFFLKKLKAAKKAAFNNKSKVNR
jgi:hypothetical protein